MSSRRVLLPFILGLIVFVGDAGATAITSTSFAGWLQNASGAVDVFGNVPTSGTYNSSSGISLSNASHPTAVFIATGPDNGSWQLTAGLYTASGHNYPSLFGASDGRGNITVSTPAGGENAVLLSLATTASTPITVTLSDGESFTPAAGVFGLSLSHDVTWLTISTTSGSKPVVDDLEFATSTLTQDAAQQASPSAEGATFALIAGGLLILIGGRRKLFNTPVE
ncbi:MAG: hypothetical protein JOY54_08680 [Acidobacteriaceae bacterium]|nr:hypothetical protein [Acidobacteriaceae bacterium]